MSSKDNGKTNASWWQGFFVGECGFSRFINLVLVVYIVGKDSQLISNVFGW